MCCTHALSPWQLCKFHKVWRKSKSICRGRGSICRRQMSKSKRIELQVTVQSQDQWNELLQKEGLIVVDAYSTWCGPCKAAVSTLKRIKNELGDNLLHFATAETDNIDSLSLYRGKSQPTFLFFANGILVFVIRGCNCPVILKTIKSQLEREHKVLEGKVDRVEFIDKEVGMVQTEEKKDGEEDVNEEDEEIAARMTESMMCMKNNVNYKGVDEQTVSNEVSLAIIKPDAVKAGLVDEIIAKVESEGMEILRKEQRTLTKEEAAEFYKQHEGSEHFEELVEFMSSGPCMTLIISKDDSGDHGVIPQIRDLIGPKDINLAKEQAPTSIRALYGTSSVMNAIHACDTSESAARELAFFYPDFVSPSVKTKKAKKQASQRTLALIRPGALKHHKDEIIAKINEAGFSIAMAKELTLTKEEAEDFYSEHKGKDFFEALVNNMCSGPVMALCLAKDDAVEGWRNMLGPKEIDVATEEAPESLRAQFKVDESEFNPLHGSDSITAADREIQKMFPVQTTVAVIKPETAAESGDEIINKIKESGFRIVSKKDIGLTKELASQFYHEHEGKDFFDGLTDYMSSGQSTVLLLEREDALTGWRAMMGPTDPNEAREKAPESIRAVFGKDIVRNAVHGSSDMTKAEKVIEELFPDVELLPNGKAQVRGSNKDLKENSTNQEKMAEDEEGGENDTGTESQQTQEDDQAKADQVTEDEGQVTKEKVMQDEGQAEGQVTNKDEGQVTELDSGGETTAVNDNGAADNTAKDDGGSSHDHEATTDVPSGVGTTDDTATINAGTNGAQDTPGDGTTADSGDTGNTSSGETDGEKQDNSEVNKDNNGGEVGEKSDSGSTTDNITTSITGDVNQDDTKSSNEIKEEIG